LCDIQGEVPVPYPWDKWTFHQYTFKLNGPLWGAESLDLDGDYYNGTLQDMIKEFNLPPLDGEIIVPEPPDTGFMMKCIKNVNVRTGPATSYPDVGDYYVGDLVGPVLDIGGGKSGAWIKIAEGRWVCVTDNYNNVYLKVEA
jgi:hypothetical protein